MLQVCLMLSSGSIPSKGRWYGLFHYIAQLFTPQNYFEVSKPVNVISPGKLVSFEYRSQVYFDGLIMNEMLHVKNKGMLVHDMYINVLIRSLINYIMVPTILLRINSPYL